eukprot:TRINITY_DN24371_c0_g1_i2.p1 TRINITY_DN24371_c0_g1~~TRINITY_DN24371_c0_g1_i2.p1  ORF type:complete len:892 (+),score=167.30 TRINITY_DN24371_c0_g1_i2:39-2678(+)
MFPPPRREDRLPSQAGTVGAASPPQLTKDGRLTAISEAPAGGVRQDTLPSKPHPPKMHIDIGQVHAQAHTERPAAEDASHMMGDPSNWQAAFGLDHFCIGSRSRDADKAQKSPRTWFPGPDSARSHATETTSQTLPDRLKIDGEAIKPMLEAVVQKEVQKLQIWLMTDAAKNAHAKSPTLQAALQTEKPVETEQLFEHLSTRLERCLDAIDTLLAPLRLRRTEDKVVEIQEKAREEVPKAEPNLDYLGCFHDAVKTTLSSAQDQQAESLARLFEKLDTRLADIAESIERVHSNAKQHSEAVQQGLDSMEKSGNEMRKTWDCLRLESKPPADSAGVKPPVLLPVPKPDSLMEALQMAPKADSDTKPLAWKEQPPPLQGRAPLDIEIIENSATRTAPTNTRQEAAAGTSSAKLDEECISSRKSMTMSKELNPTQSTTTERTRKKKKRGIRDLSPGDCLKAFSIFLVVTNAGFLGWTSHMSVVAAFANGETPAWTLTVEIAFAVLFCIELGSSLFIKRSDWWLDKQERLWNFMDAFLVLSAVVDVVLKDYPGLVDMSTLRGFRLIRVLRLLRVVKQLQTLRLMAAMIGSAFCSVLWALVFLFLFTYMAAVFFMQVIGDRVAVLKRDGPELLSHSDEQFLADAEQYYGGMGRCLMNLIGTVSGGVDWIDVAMPIAEISGFYLVAFNLYVMFLVFGLLNILTGIIVEHARDSLTVDRELGIQLALQNKQSMEKDLMELTQHWDINGDGQLSHDELLKHLQDEEFVAELTDLNLTVDEAIGVFKLIDPHSTGTASIDTFVRALLRFAGSASHIDVATMLFEMKRGEIRQESYMIYTQQQFDLICQALRVNSDGLRSLKDIVAAAEERDVDIFGLSDDQAGASMLE